jgi:hypothetical protein
MGNDARINNKYNTAVSIRLSTHILIRFVIYVVIKNIELRKAFSLIAHSFTATPLLLAFRSNRNKRTMKQKHVLKVINGRSLKIPKGGNQSKND